METTQDELKVTRTIIRDELKVTRTIIRDYFTFISPRPIYVKVRVTFNSSAQFM
jgi:hypothetical protein